MSIIQCSNELFVEIEKRRQVVDRYLHRPDFRERFHPDHLTRAVYCYLTRPAKRLRPALLLFACGAAGGSEARAVPAAAAIEVFHTWTLVHDDLIDNDSVRRGGPTVHEQARQWAEQEFDHSAVEAVEYGRDVALMAGDLQHAWSVSLLLACATEGDVDPGLVLRLVALMQSELVNGLLCGEMLDVQFSRRPLEEVTQDQVLEMLRLKTGLLFGFAAKTGACIGSGELPGRCAVADALSDFASTCGIAFQLQDDILGVIGDETKLGKPVGSDLREGKRTAIVTHAWRHASAVERTVLAKVLGNRQASDREIEKLRELLLELGGIEATAALARQYVDRALAHLAAVPDSGYRDLFAAWAELMVNREF